MCVTVIIVCFLRNVSLAGRPVFSLALHCMHVYVCMYRDICIYYNCIIYIYIYMYIDR